MSVTVNRSTMVMSPGRLVNVTPGQVVNFSATALTNKTPTVPPRTFTAFLWAIPVDSPHADKPIYSYQNGGDPFYPPETNVNDFNFGTITSGGVYTAPMFNPARAAEYQSFLVYCIDPANYDCFLNASVVFSGS